MTSHRLTVSDRVVTLVAVLLVACVGIQGWQTERQLAADPAPVRQVADQKPLPAAAGGWPARPEPGMSMPAVVTRVIDGDTVEVQLVPPRVRVRLLECWCPESRTRDAAEKTRGLAAKKYLTDKANRRDCTLWLPIHSEDLGAHLTLGRVLGHVWLVDDPKSLSQHMVEAGHAQRAKSPGQDRPAKPGGQ